MLIQGHSIGYYIAYLFNTQALISAIVVILSAAKNLSNRLMVKHLRPCAPQNDRLDCLSQSGRYIEAGSSKLALYRERS